jgi:hypothetical protein
MALSPMAWGKYCPLPSANSLLRNDVGIAAGSAGRWDDRHHTVAHRGAEMLGSISAGGQIIPFDRDNSLLKLALPVVSPRAGTAKPPVLASQTRLGVDEIGGGAVRSDCADTFVAAARMVTPTMIQNRMRTSDVVIEKNGGRRRVVPRLVPRICLVVAHVAIDPRTATEASSPTAWSMPVCSRATALRLERPLGGGGEPFPRWVVIECGSPGAPPTGIF